jgi:WD40 repeat protein
MRNASAEASNPDRGLDDLLALYLEETEAGRSPDRAAWLALYPEYAAELSAFFANLDHVGRIADPLRRDHLSPTLSFPTVATAPVEGGRVGYFGDYELIREIARGGMGVVFAARQVSLDRMLALKMITDGPGTSTDDLRRFRLETEAVAHLDHPHIVPIYEVGEHAGHRYYSMKLVDGGTLATEAPRLRGDLREAARVVATTARAIHYAHRRGILHRDLKPSNILFDRQGRPMVADFGLARRIDAAGDLTRTGSIVGTPAYMAPEQAEGRRESVTTAVDVYGLGAILYEVLTGRPPHRGDSTLETLRKVRDEEPERPTAIDPRLPRDLETICLKCLEKPPGRRYPSAEAVADDLDRWLAGLPIAARPTTLPERGLKWARRRPTAAALVATGIIAIAAAAFAVQQTRSVVRLDDQVREAEAKVTRRIESESLAESEGYLDKIKTAQKAWASNDIATAQRILDACPAATRQWEWSYLEGLIHSEIRTISGHSGMSCGVAFAPSSGVFCCPDERGGVAIWDDRSDRAITHIRGHDGFAYGVAFDREGKRLATAGSDGRVRLWDVSNGTLLHTLTGHGEWAAGVAFNRDASRLVSGGADRVVRVWNTATGAEVLALRGHTGAVLGVAFRPDGGQIASAGLDPVIRLWNAETGREERTLPADPEATRSLAYRPDGLRLASGGADRRVRIWDIGSGNEIRGFVAASGRVDGLAFSPDGTRLATGGLDRSVTIWEAATGRELASYRGHAAPVFSVAFSPDGSRLASSGQDATVKLWDATSPPEARLLQGGGRPIVGLMLSRDGSIAVASAENGVMTAWDVATGRQLWSSSGRGVISSPVAHPEGRLVLATGGDQVVRSWDLASGTEGVVVPRVGEPVASLAITPDGRSIITGGGEPITIVHELRGKGVPNPSAPRSVRIWDAATGREVRRMNGHVGSIHLVRVRPDGAQLASAGSDGTLRIWDLSTGREIHTLRGHNGAILDAAFSADSTLIASAGVDGRVRLWDVATGQERTVIAAHSGWATGVAFSPDGSRLASVGADGALRLWEASSGREVLTLLADTVRRTSVAFSPDGRRLAAGSGDGNLRVLSLPHPESR